MTQSQQIQSFMIPGGGYGYTGTPVDSLMSFENTLATALLDESGSTSGFARDMELCTQAIVKSLRHCPRQDNLIYRHCHFGTNFREVHGFKPLSQCNEADYDGCYQPGGTTNLYGSCKNVLLATLDYAEKQAANRYLVNGIVYIITDGQHYAPGESATPDDVKLALAKCISSESLESLITILIGVNPNDKIRKSLKEFHDYVGFTQFIPMDEANEKSLAKLGNFISKSIQSQSQALGTKGPSQSLTF